LQASLNSANCGRDNTIVAAMERRFRDEPTAEVCRLVSEDGRVIPVTAQALMARAMAFATHFGRVTTDRKTIGICLYHGLDLHASFIGALWAGHIPTMLAPPSPRMEVSKYRDSLRRMIGHIRPAMMVLDSECLSRLDCLEVTNTSQTTLVNPAEVVASGYMEPYRPEPSEVAFVQHSSGTTGLQKGIALSHQAVLAHNASYREALRISRQDVIVSWLPLYHDMGFIACFILPLLEGIPFVELSPFEWVLKPAILFEQIYRNRGTLVWLPNFAYAFMADNVSPEKLAEGCSLASIRAWINCSEPVSHASQSKFLERFRHLGVSDGQFTASYAMAENVFAATQSLPGDYRPLEVDKRTFIQDNRVQLADGSEALTFVSNGRAVKGTEIRVHDTSGSPLPSGVVGELALRGDFLFSGYFGRDDLTREAMTADGWYSTGDLGFLVDDEVYVTGRKKDMIIIQGRNFYPTDIESVACTVHGIIPGRAVAFGLPDPISGTESLVVLAETALNLEQERKKVALVIRKKIAQEMDCTPADVRVLPPKWLIKSTSGKLARKDNREKYCRTFLAERSCSSQTP
jgi:fatty-acyl-CoA synthase